MGYLHEGHLSLVRRAIGETDTVVVSIFVNPTQFGPSEDLATYPRDLPRDLAMLEREGVDLVFAPSADEIYPAGFQTRVTVGDLSQMLIVQPDRAYFGQKDAQQALLIKQMVRDLSMDIQVIVCPTVREPDGLAMSSRNAYLAPDERKAAVVLYQALTAAKELWEKGERRGEHLRQAMRQVIAAQPLAQMDYASVSDTETLQELDEVCDSALLAVAVRIGRTRLIDNIIVGKEGL